MEGREKHSPPSRLLLQQVEKHNRTHNSFVCLWLSRCGLFLWLQTDGLWFSFPKKRKKNPTWRLSPFTDIVCGGCSICPPSVVSRLQKKKKREKRCIRQCTKRIFKIKRKTKELQSCKGERHELHSKRVRPFSNDSLYPAKCARATPLPGAPMKRRKAIIIRTKQ